MRSARVHSTLRRTDQAGRLGGTGSERGSSARRQVGAFIWQLELAVSSTAQCRCLILFVLTVDKCGTGLRVHSSSTRLALDSRPCLNSSPSTTPYRGLVKCLRLLHSGVRKSKLNSQLNPQLNPQLNLQLNLEPWRRLVVTAGNCVEFELQL